MKTYLIQNDGYNYQEFNLEIDDILDFVPDVGTYDIMDIYDFSLNNLSFKSWWKEIESGFTAIDGDKKATIPDVSRWIGATLILSPKAYLSLKDLLHSHGELLPIKCNDEVFYIFNCLDLAKANESLSKQKLFKGDVVGIEKLIFDDENIEGKCVFKTKYTNCLDIFCNQEFKDAVLKYDLNGIVFNENLASEF